MLTYYRVRSARQQRVRTLRDAMIWLRPAGHHNLICGLARGKRRVLVRRGWAGENVTFLNISSGTW